MIGRIVSNIAGTYKVLIDNKYIDVKARGNFKYKGMRLTVGDFVTLSEDNSAIISLEPRHSLLLRPRIANVDYILVVMSLLEPSFSYSLIFKYLTYANMNEIPASIVISKIDKSSNNEKIEEIKQVFNKLNIPIHFVDSKHQKGVDELKNYLTGKTFVLVGTSAVGKSTLLNALDQSFKRQEGEFSYALKGGKHQTKETILFPFNGGYIADTPGFYNLDLGLNKKDFAKYYPGINQKYVKCYYSDCMHLLEKNCAIKEAVTNGEIPQIVYESYIQELKNLEQGRN